MFQLREAGLLLMLLTLFIVPALSDIILGSRGFWGWDWKTDVRLFGWLGLTGWLEMCLVSLATCQAGSILENTTSSADETAFQLRVLLRLFPSDGN